MSLILMALPLVLMAQQYSLDELIQAGMEKSWTTQRGRLSYESSVPNAPALPGIFYPMPIWA
jgi:hypothetical protein